MPAVLLAQSQSGSMGDLTKAAGEAAGYAEDTNEYSLAEFAGVVARTFISLIGIIFVSYTIYGGYLWMTAGGNEENIAKAKNILKNGIIGLIIVFCSAAIYIFIRNNLITGTGGGSGDSGLTAS